MVKSAKRAIYSEAEDYVHAVLGFSTGLTGSMDVCWSVRNYRLPEVHVEIHGRKGALFVSDDHLRVELDEGTPALMPNGKHQVYKPSFNSSVSFLLADPEYTLEDQAFLEALSRGQKCRPDFNDAAKVNWLIDRIHKEAENGN